MLIERDQLKTLIVVAAVSAVFAVGLWLPAHFTQKKLREQIVRLEQNIRTAKQNKENMAQWQIEIHGMHKVLDKHTRYVPENEELGGVLHGLSNALQNNNAIEQNVLTAETARYVDYSVIPVTMEYIGSFTDTYGILREIECMPRLIRIENLAVLQSYQREDDNLLKINMQVSSFYSKREGPGS